MCGANIGEYIVFEFIHLGLVIISTRWYVLLCNTVNVDIDSIPCRVERTEEIRAFRVFLPQHLKR